MPVMIFHTDDGEKTAIVPETAAKFIRDMADELTMLKEDKEQLLAKVKSQTERWAAQEAELQAQDGELEDLRAEVERLREIERKYNQAGEFFGQLKASLGR